MSFKSRIGIVEKTSMPANKNSLVLRKNRLDYRESVRQKNTPPFIPCFSCGAGADESAARFDTKCYWYTCCLYCGIRFLVGRGRFTPGDHNPVKQLYTCPFGKRDISLISIHQGKKHDILCYVGLSFLFGLGICCFKGGKGHWYFNTQN